MQGSYLLELDHVSMAFRRGTSLKTMFSNPHRLVHAPRHVSLNLRPREIVGLAGESGSGKSTIANLVVKLMEPSGGELRYEGRSLAGMQGADLRRLRREVQWSSRTLTSRSTRS